MLITIDTSVLIAVASDEPSKPRIVELTVGHELVAPACLHWEVGNALSGMLKRERISEEEASAAIAVYESIPIRLVDVGLTEALGFSVRHRMYAYDAYMLACAVKTKSTLLSLDHALVNIARSERIRILEV